MTPPPAPGPRAVTTPTASARRNQIIALAVFVIALVVVVRACAGGENRYEKQAHEYTQAIQDGNLAAAQKLMNSGAGADLPRARFGAASDKLSRLGKIHRVHENTPSSAAPRVHEFDIAFDKGSIHETIEFDPDGKIYHFNFIPVARR